MLKSESVHTFLLKKLYVSKHICPSVPIHILGDLCAWSSRPSHLFAFPEHQVHEATDECHGEANPCQDIGGSIKAFLKTGQMKG